MEDSRYGVEAARAAGMRAFGYAGGLTAAERLAGPSTTVFHDMRELPELLEPGVSGRCRAPAVPRAGSKALGPPGGGPRALEPCGAVSAGPTGAPVLPDRAPAGGFQARDAGRWGTGVTQTWARGATDPGLRLRG